MSSILQDVKHKIGPSEEYDYFDKDILDAINEAFSVLIQLGAGQATDFQVEDATTTWDAFTEDVTLQNLVKTYVYKKVQVIFDPPNNASHLSAIQEQIAELEWRISVWVDPEK